MGYIRGLTHGAVAGAIFALLYAPDKGTVTRRRLSRWLVETEDMIAGGSRPAQTTVGPRRRAAAGGTEDATRRS